ncbi:MAG: hypothetical protein IIA60_05435 [Candidatus Marinimicrobia bacterium]|nr:hypothetical protein [Candidatus Neomarinimicrobiota bacterium]
MNLRPCALLAGLLWLPVATWAGQPLRLQGQLWATITGGDDPAPGFRPHAELVGYIPTLSLARELPRGRLIDLEWAYRAGWAATGLDSTGSTTTFGRHHRLWARYSSPALEARFGLQKIAFGPGRILRPLAWFDNIDPEDPTNQTDGVNALRLRFFPSANLALWSWVVISDQWQYYSPGVRLEAALPLGEVGLTWYDQRQSGFHSLGQMPVAPLWGHNRRLALDLRYDGLIGLWTESFLVLPRAAPQNPGRQLFIMLGGDYTFGIGNGLYIMLEQLWLPAADDDPSGGQQLAALLASWPLGSFDQLMVILYHDWDSSRTYSYFRWARVYDRTSFNIMVSRNPRRSDYGNQFLDPNLAGFGTSLNFMLVYNH